MDLTPYLETVRTDLEAVSGADEATLAVAERLARALEPSLQLRLLEALGQAAQELSEQFLPSARVDVRLSGRDVQLVVAFDEVPAEPAPEEEGGTARMTLRLPESTKTRVEQHADREGISTNSWLVRAVLRGLEQQQHQRHRRAGNRMTGIAQSEYRRTCEGKEGHTMERTFDTPGHLQLDLRIPAGSIPGSGRSRRPRRSSPSAANAIPKTSGSCSTTLGRVSSD